MIYSVATLIPLYVTVQPMLKAGRKCIGKAKSNSDYAIALKSESIPLVSRSADWLGRAPLQMGLIGAG
jgi:hypothetical protein